jgi:hypothetical protein
MRHAGKLPPVLPIFDHEGAGVVLSGKRFNKFRGFGVKRLPCKKGKRFKPEIERIFRHIDEVFCKGDAAKRLLACVEAAEPEQGTGHYPPS